MNNSITRRKWTDEQRKAIIDESLTTSGQKVIKKYNLSTSLFYKWKKEYMINYAKEKQNKYENKEIDNIKNDIVDLTHDIQLIAQQLLTAQMDIKSLYATCYKLNKKFSFKNFIKNHWRCK